MEERVKILIDQLGELRIKQNLPVSTFKPNGVGTISLVYIATTGKELIKAVELSRQLQVPFLVLGSASKFEFSDPPFTGLIIKNASEAIKIFGIKGKVSAKGLGIEEASLEIDSGITVSKLLEYCQKQQLTGLEFLKGLSGTLGGNLFTNPALTSYFDLLRVLDDSEAVETKSAGQVQLTDIFLSAIIKLRSSQF